MLIQDVAYAEHAVEHLVRVPLSQGRYEPWSPGRVAREVVGSHLDHAEGAERGGLCPAQLME
jgi:hypothetical protein